MSLGIYFGLFLWVLSLNRIFYMHLFVDLVCLCVCVYLSSLTNFDCCSVLAFTFHAFFVDRCVREPKTCSRPLQKVRHPRQPSLFNQLFPATILQLPGLARNCITSVSRIVSDRFWHRFFMVCLSFSSPFLFVMHCVCISFVAKWMDWGIASVCVCLKANDKSWSYWMIASKHAM